MQRTLNRQRYANRFFIVPRPLAGAFLAAALVLLTPAFGQATFAGSQLPLGAGTWGRPAGIAVDAGGDVFVADAANGAVVELTSASGTFAPPVTVLSGLSNPSTLALDGRGNLLVADSGNGRVVMLPAGVSGLGAAQTIISGLGAPAGMAFDSAGNLYFADSQNDVVMKAPLVGGVYGAPVVVGSGYNGPVGVALDGAGDLYVADTGNRRVAQQRYSSGTFASPTSYITSITPTAIWSDKAGDLYIGDSSTPRILEYTWVPPLMRYAGAVPIGSQLSTPSGVAVDSKGNTFIADAGRGAVLEVVSTMVPFGSIAIGSSSAPITYNFSVTAGTSLGQATVSMQGSQGKDFVNAGPDTCSEQTFSVLVSCGISVGFQPLGAGIRKGAIEVTDGSGNPVATTFLYGTGVGTHANYVPAQMTVLASQLSAPGGVAVDGSGDVFISDTGNNRVLELPSTGAGYGSLLTLPVTGLNAPAGLAIDGAGDLYVASYGNDLVIRLPWLGNQWGEQSRVGTGLYGPSSIATDSLGNVYVAETLAQRVIRIPWSGSKFLAETGLGSYVREPVGVAVATNENVLFSSPYSNAVAQVQWTGSGYGGQIYLSNLNTSFPSQLAMDGNNNLFLLDSAKNQVVMLPWLGASYGSQITVANGFNAPQGLAIDSQGALYVADTGNNRVVKIDLSSAGALSFPSTYVGSASSGGAQSALVVNTGNASLDVEEVSFPPDFSETSASTCVPGLSLAAATGCSLTVNFTPVQPGNPLIESLGVDSGSGALASQAAFTLSGTAIPQVSQSINFPAIPPVTYGNSPVTLTATASSGLPVQYQVLSGPGVLSKSGNTYSLRFSGAGIIQVAAMQGGNSQYQAAAPVTLAITVQPAVLTVIPVSTNATYGKVPSSFSYSLVGAVNGDNPLNVTSGKPAFTTTALSNAPVGSYTIIASQGTLSATNYVFAFATGILTITKAALQVNATAVSQVYGGSLPALTWTVSGFVNGDTSSVVSGAPTLATTARPGSPVGSYPISISQGSLSAANYSFVLQGANLTVTAAQLMVRASSVTTTYGNAPPAFTYTITGFVNGDTSAVVTGAPVLSSTASSKSGVGIYPITIAPGTLKSANYTFTLINGTATVSKAPLALIANNISAVQGSPLPALTYSASGLVNGDTLASATAGAPALSTTANMSAPGTYPISIAQGTMSSPNYQLSFRNGVLTVTAPAALTLGKATPQQPRTRSKANGVSPAR